MANAIPASLKSADLTRFAHRAAQLEKPKPAVAYWCNFWILNQILAKNLHNADDEALAYTTELMDKVERFKSANLANDAVTDEIAGKAYVEQFGLETFAKADNAVRANKVSISTADTFQAAATFLELLGIWGQLDQDISAKVKYAKFHAVRVLKAVRAGEDPNLSNPNPEPEPETMLPELDPNDAEVQALEGSAPNARRASVVEIPDEADRMQARLAKTSSLDQSLHPSRDQSETRPPGPSVVDVLDETHRMQSRLANVSSKDESLHPSRVPSRPTSENGNGNVSPLAPQDAAAFYTSNQTDISPIEPKNSERKPSVGGNYFPIVANQLPSAPTGHSTNPSLDLPSAPAEPTLSQAPSTFATESSGPPPQAAISPPPVVPGPSMQQQPPQIPPNYPPPRQTTFHQQPPPTQSHITQPQPQRPPQSYTQQPPPPQNVVYAPPMNQANPPPPIVHPVVQPPVQSNVVLDEEAIMRAQKHARWAISALNFEDVPTAIRELQGALAVLGAR